MNGRTLTSIFMVLLALSLHVQATGVARADVNDELRKVLADEKLRPEQKMEAVVSISGGFEQRYSKALLDDEGIQLALKAVRDGSSEMAEDMVRWILFSVGCNRRAFHDLVYPILEDESVPLSRRLALMRMHIEVRRPESTPEFSRITRTRLFDGRTVEGINRFEDTLLGMLRADRPPAELIETLNAAPWRWPSKRVKEAILALLDHPDTGVRRAAVRAIPINTSAGTERVMGEVHRNIECFGHPERRGGYMVADRFLTMHTGVKRPPETPPEEFWPKWWEEEGKTAFLRPESRALLRSTARNYASHYVAIDEYDRLIGLFAVPELVADLDKKLLAVHHHRGLKRPEEEKPEEFWPRWWAAERRVHVAVRAYLRETLLDENASVDERRECVIPLMALASHTSTSEESEEIGDLFWQVLNSPKNPPELRNECARGVTSYGLVRADNKQERRDRIIEMAVASLHGEESHLTRKRALECLTDLGKPDEEVREIIYQVFADAQEDPDVRGRAAFQLAVYLRSSCGKRLLKEIVSFARQQRDADLKAKAVPGQRVTPHKVAYRGARWALVFAADQMLTEEWTLEQWEAYVDGLPDEEADGP